MTHPSAEQKKYEMCSEMEKK